KVFDRLVKKNRKDLSKAAKALAKQDRREQKQFEQVEKKYNKMLWKREVRLMTSYGFKNTRTGWINIDKPRRGKEIGIEIPLVATVKDADEFELVTVYAVFPYIKCLNAFKKTGTNTFGPDISDRNTIPVATTKQSIIIAIAHKGEKTYYAEEVFTGGKRQTFNLELEEISQQELQRAIGQFDDFPQNSNIRKDQEFQKKKLTKLRRDKQRRKEQFAMEALFYFVTNPCLKIDFNADVVNGERLYKENCASCHKPIGKLVGPQLAGVFQKYTMQMDWRFMIEFTRNSPQLIKDGDPKAVALWNEYNQAAMQAFPTLSDQDIVDILAFCDAIEYAE
ncbi:MAG: cytochrome c, partial [Bacteroidia bacterium]